jgi:hypothetical protein
MVSRLTSVFEQCVAIRSKKPPMDLTVRRKVGTLTP